MEPKITRIRKFINSQRLYMWLVVFIIMVNSLAIFTNKTAAPIPEKAVSEEMEKMLSPADDIVERQLIMQAKLIGNKGLAITIALVLISIVFFTFAGIIVNLTILILKLRGTEVLKTSLSLPAPGWTIWDVCKVMILFLSCAYALLFIEAGLAAALPFLETQKSMRAAFNNTILDVLGISFIFYFVIFRYRQRLQDIGLSMKNFFRNLFYGVAGYVAVVPLLVAVFLFVFWLTTLFKYQPKPQPVMELLVEEKNTSLLMYISVFAGILGPIAEEIFFRGFMYGAIKKKAGVKGALFLSAFLFALFHVHLVGFLPIFLLGLLLAYLYEKTGSLVASTTVHIIHNLIMLFFVFLLKEIYL